jgi:heat shock protein HslJ
MKLQLITIALTAFTIYSCGTTKQNEAMDNADASANSITEVYWKLETLEGKNVSTSEIRGKEIGFTLAENDNRITGFAGCNNFFGNFTLEAGNSIKFLALGSTRMACPDLTFNESEFLKIFELADNYTINGHTLSFNVGKGSPLAVFKKKAKLSEPITEKYWKLKSLEGQEVKMAKNQQKETYFMLKTDENRVSGFAGCNTFSGSYTLEEGNKIRFSQMATTMMACPDLDFNESEFLKVFELTDNYTVKDDVLSLNIGRRAPLAVFEAVYFE